MIMKPIFNRDGKTVSWLKGLYVFDRSGQPRAFIRGSSVYNFYGGYLGRFAKGYFWDSLGHAVAFVGDAAGGPALPETEFSPPAPLTTIPPPLPEISNPPLPPNPTLLWSPLDWKVYLES